MARGRPVRGSEIPWEDIGRRLGRWGWGRILGIVVGIVVVIWLLSGIYTVGPGEQGVVRQFGKQVGLTGPGLHYHWPGPIQRVDKVNIEVIRTVEVGFRTVAVGPPPRFELWKAESMMLTGEANIVNAQVIVQYRVRDASNYLFKLRDPEAAIHAATEVALRSVVGQNTIDYVMIDGRSIVQDEAMAFLQRLMDAYESGLQITVVKLQAVDPPEQVKDAFDEVVRAREDKDKLIREAEGYAADIVPRARGEAEQTILAASAYREQRIIRAQGDVERFLKVLEEYLKAPDVTRQRLYLETIERVLPDIEKIVIDPQSGGNLLQFLPLKELIGSGEVEVESEGR